MCEICDQNMGRRRFLGLAAAGLAAGLFAPSIAFAAGGPTTTVTADEALAKLKAGNARYLSEPQVCAVDLAHAREQVAHGQAPWATILSCADSRVAPELL